MSGRRQVVAAVTLLAVLAACRPSAEAPRESAPSVPRRIVSLAPSLTETLFAIGVGDRVVGATRYCNHPPAARRVLRIGGHLDPNLEAIVALEPDLVVSIPSSRDSRLRLEGLGLPVLEVDQRDVAAILESVTELADRCGVAERGAALRASMEDRLERVERLVAGVPRPRAVVVVGHQSGAEEVRAVWAAGRDTFYDGVLEIAGGDNAVDVAGIRYPELSREGLAALDPDVILDVIAAAEAQAMDVDRLRTSWRRLRELRAVREGRVQVLVGDELVVPGPRLPELVETLARALHPNLDWGAE